MKNQDNIFKMLQESDNDIIKWFAMASVTILANRIDEAAKQKDTVDIETIKKQSYDEGYKQALQDVNSEIKRTSKTLSKLIGGND